MANEHARRHGVEVNHLYRHAVHGYAARMTEQAAAQLAIDPRVASVQPDRTLTATTQGTPTGLNRMDRQRSSTAAGDGSGSVEVDLAVLDTGIDLDHPDHPDLNVVVAKDCVA